MDDPDMIDPRWTWLAVPFWWTVTLLYKLWGSLPGVRLGKKI